MNNLKAVFYIICCSLFLSSCSDDLSIEENTTTISPRPDVKVNATITGLILDEEEMPLPDAQITIDNQSELSDINGYFSLSGLYNQGGTLIVVKKIGYYDAHGTVLPTEDGIIQVKFVLTPKDNPVEGSAQNDLIIETGDYSIFFQADGFKIADSDYTGNIKVHARYIDPSSSIDRDKLPGVLLTKSEGIKKLITPLAMLDVDLKTDDDNSVQVSKDVRLSINIPPALWSVAPSEAPLYYYDFEDGLWKEEGLAVRNGNKYEGVVSHFSTWCVGVSNDFLIVSGTIKRDGQPYAFAKHRIYGSEGYYTADQKGDYVRLAIRNEPFSLKILDACLTVIHEEEIMASSEDLNIDVNITSSGNSLELSGTLLDCASDVVNTGYVLIKFENNSFFELYPINEDGSYSIFYESCNTSNITIKGYDFENQITSEPINVSTSNEIDIVLCESIAEYQLTISIEGEEPYIINNCIVSVTDNSSGSLVGKLYRFTVIDAFTDFPDVEGESVTYQWGVTIFENEGVPPLLDLNPLPVKTNNPPILWLLQFDTQDLSIIRSTDELIELRVGVTEEFSDKIVNGVIEELDGKTTEMRFVAEIQ